MPAMDSCHLGSALPPKFHRAERWFGAVTGGGPTGSVNVNRRFGSSLGLNRYFLVLLVDGV